MPSFCWNSVIVVDGVDGVEQLVGNRSRRSIHTPPTEIESVYFGDTDGNCCLCSSNRDVCICYNSDHMKTTTTIIMMMMMSSWEQQQQRQQHHHCWSPTKRYIFTETSREDGESCWSSNKTRTTSSTTTTTEVTTTNQTHISILMHSSCSSECHHEGWPLVSYDGTESFWQKAKKWC